MRGMGRRVPPGTCCQRATCPPVHTWAHALQRCIPPPGPSLTFVPNCPPSPPHTNQYYDHFDNNDGADFRVAIDLPTSSLEAWAAVLLPTLRSNIYATVRRGRGACLVGSSKWGSSCCH